MPEHRHIRPLTSIRFPFALLVVFNHHKHLFELAGYHSWGAVIPNLIDNGYIGVTYFFVLSGFILTYTYADQFDGRFKEQFWIARFARIYPVYLLGVVLELPIVLQGIPGSRIALPLSLEAGLTGTLQITLMQAWVPGAALSWNSAGWSLSAEAFFYLLFPVLAVPLSRWSIRALIALAVGAYATSLMIAFLGVSIPLDLDLARYNPVFRLPAFLLGIIAGVVFLRYGSALRNWGWALFLLGFLGSLVIVGLFGRAIPYLYMHDDLLAPFAMLLMLGLALMDGLPARILSYPLFVRLGAASYALYIVHGPLSGLLFMLDPAPYWTRDHPLLYFWIYLAIVLVASILVLEKLEEPCRRAILRKLASSHLRPVVLAR
jgi:peptidoglycan/LPS O-acetylase OafA/YrhL